MDFALKPYTEAGLRFVSLAEQHMAEFAKRAKQYDHEQKFPTENFEAMRQSHVLAACVPSEFGGLGVESIHDFVIGMSRLGRGDASTAIAVNMHLFVTWNMARNWRAALAAGQQAQAERPAGLLRRVGAGDLVLCALVSEHGTDFLHPLVEGTKTDGGWLINGRKGFGTNSPMADLTIVTFRVQDAQGHFRFAQTMLARGHEGMEIANNWDALGMRSSGSHDVVFSDCFVPDHAVVDRGPWGQWSEDTLTAYNCITIALVGVFLGIAEATQELILDAVKTGRKGPNQRKLADQYAIQHSIAENEIDLATARAMLERTLKLADDVLISRPIGQTPLSELHSLVKDFQCTKWVVNRKAIEIVDRALAISGGSGYLSKNPLSRFYRDVRAGPFMQPFSPNEAFEYIGKVALGLDPVIDSWQLA